MIYKRYFKRILDISLTVIGLIIASPFFIVIIIFLIVHEKERIWFKQSRTGKNGLPFNLLKLRTMSDIRDATGKLLPDAKRVTKLGQKLRKNSFDELPQLLNVIKGDMSLVGPRPLLPDYLPLYNERQARRHEVRPGITGLAQVNGRNALSWEEKFEMDVWYVDNVSFLLDMTILFQTLAKVLMREGINSGPNVTMERFKGTSKS